MQNTDDSKNEKLEELIRLFTQMQLRTMWFGKNFKIIQRIMCHEEWHNISMLLQASEECIKNLNSLDKSFKEFEAMLTDINHNS